MPFTSTLRYAFEKYASLNLKNCMSPFFTFFIGRALLRYGFAGVEIVFSMGAESKTARSCWEMENFSGACFDFCAAEGKARNTRRAKTRFFNKVMKRRS